MITIALFLTEEQPEVDEFGTPKGFHAEGSNEQSKEDSKSRHSPKTSSRNIPAAISETPSILLSTKPRSFTAEDSNAPSRSASNTPSRSGSAKSIQNSFSNLEAPLSRSASVRIKGNDFETANTPSRSSSVRTNGIIRVSEGLSRSASVRIKNDNLLAEPLSRSASVKTKANHFLEEPLSRSASVKTKAHTFDNGEALPRASSVKVKGHTLEALVSPFQSLFDLAASASPRLSRKSSVKKSAAATVTVVTATAAQRNGDINVGEVSLSNAVDSRNNVIKNGILKSPSVQTPRLDRNVAEGAARFGGAKGVNRDDAQLNGGRSAKDGKISFRDSLDATSMCPYGFPSPKSSEDKMNFAVVLITGFCIAVITAMSFLSTCLDFV